ncbi:MAG: L-serine ammonia-lyase, iron-sulfur-dependent, subunit alpha [Mucinivorans sp.]
MDCSEYQKFIDLIHREVKPALGCTEPIAVALAACRSSEALREMGLETQNLEVEVSPNILKNGMGVGIPATGMVGLHIAAALGAVCGKSQYKLEVLNGMCHEGIEKAKKLVSENKVEVKISPLDIKLYIRVTCLSDGHTACTTIQDIHDNITMVEVDGETIFNSQTHKDDSTEQQQNCQEQEMGLTVKSIYDFAVEVPFEKIAFILEAAKLNRAIATEGLKHKYGLQVGRTISNNITRHVFGDGILTYSMAMTAAASDARMAGSTLPAMSNSGSGNQGITATLPVVASAEKLGSTDEQLARALIISHLVSIHIKHSLGRLSALCGCVVASSGSACGVAYLMGGSYKQMTYAIKNMIGDVTGMVCDGAKVGCALKVSSGVAAAIQSAMLAMDNIEISDNDGIIEADIEKTIFNLSTIGTQGMINTDRLMLQIMVNKKHNGITCS